MFSWAKIPRFWRYYILYYKSWDALEFILFIKNEFFIVHFRLIIITFDNYYVKLYLSSTSPAFFQYIGRKDVKVL